MQVKGGVNCSSRSKWGGKLVFRNVKRKKTFPRIAQTHFGQDSRLLTEVSGRESQERKRLSELEIPPGDNSCCVLAVSLNLEQQKPLQEPADKIQIYDEGELQCALYRFCWIFSAQLKG